LRARYKQRYFIDIFLKLILICHFPLLQIPISYHNIYSYFSKFLVRSHFSCCGYAIPGNSFIVHPDVFWSCSRWASVDGDRDAGCNSSIYWLLREINYCYLNDMKIVVTSIILLTSNFRRIPTFITYLSQNGISYLKPKFPSVTPKDFLVKPKNKDLVSCLWIGARSSFKSL